MRRGVRGQSDAVFGGALRFLDPERCMTLTPSSPPKGELTRIRAGGHPAFLACHVSIPSRFRLVGCTADSSIESRCLAYSHISPTPSHPTPVTSLSVFPKNLYISFLAASVRRPINSLCRPRPALPPTDLQPPVRTPTIHSREKIDGCRTDRFPHLPGFRLIHRE